MAVSKKSLANLKPVKPGGAARNPTGKTNPTLREVRKLTRQQVTEIGSVLLKGDYKALVAIADREDLPFIQTLIARIAERASDRRDHKAFAVLLDQVIGKQAQEVKVQLSAHASLVKLVNGEPDEEGEDDEET